jgi:hypothetical protein
MKSASRANGIRIDGDGGVSSRSEGLLALAQILRSSGGPQLTRRKVDRNPVVDNAGLDAIVLIPKGCRQRHNTLAEG